MTKNTKKPKESTPFKVAVTRVDALNEEIKGVLCRDTKIVGSLTMNSQEFALFCLQLGPTVMLDKTCSFSDGTQKVNNWKEDPMFWHMLWKMPLQIFTHRGQNVYELCPADIRKDLQDDDSQVNKFMDSVKLLGKLRDTTDG